MPLGGDDLDIVHPNAAQFGGNKFCRLQHIALMFIERADAGDAEKRLQFVEKTRLIITGKIDCRGSHSLLPFWRAGRGSCESPPKTVQYIPEWRLDPNAPDRAYRSSLTCSCRYVKLRLQT